MAPKQLKARRRAALIFRQRNPAYHRDLMRRWRKSHPTETKEAMRKWREANPKKKAASNARWIQANLKRLRKNYLKNYDKNLLVTKAWRKANPTKYKLIGRRGAWKLLYKLSQKDVEKMLKTQKSACLFCRVDLTILSCTVDHAQPKSRGGSTQARNLQLVCLPCNLGKGQMTAFEYVQHCRRVVKAQRRVR